MTQLATPGQVMGRLSDIEDDIAKRQNDYETAASAKATLTRQWAKRMAQRLVAAEGTDAKAREAAALIAAINEDDLYERLSEAEGTVAACAAAMKSDETRAMIGMAILRAQGRS